jgi:hypothetical protein
MRLNALLLADAVSAPPDGKFYIHGGGLTRLSVPVLPFAIPQLGVLVRLESGPEEIGKIHEFAFELVDPDGNPVAALPRFTAEVPPPLPGMPEPEEGEQRFVVLGLNLAGITVGRRGLHQFRFLLDGEELGAIPLPVTVPTPEQLAAAAGAIHLEPPRPPTRPRAPQARKPRR